MTRLVLAAAAVTAALAGAFVAVWTLGLPGWLVVPAAAAVGLALAGLARLSHAWLIAHRLRRRSDAGGARALVLAQRLHAAARRQGGFSDATGALPALERAVLFGGRGASLADTEAAVLTELRISTAMDRRDLVQALRDLQDAAVRALSSPAHPLFFEARRVLALLGHRPPRIVGESVARSQWKARRPGTDPGDADTCLAAHLLRAGMPRAAHRLLDPLPATPRRRRLRRVVDCVALIDRFEGGRLVAVPTRELVAAVEELLLLAGRRVPDLVPGSTLLREVPGGAAALEKFVRATSSHVAALAQVAREWPALEERVARVLARALRRPIGAILSAVRAGTLTARADAALVSHLRGLALLDEERPREAAAEFASALVIAPDFQQAAFALATVRRELGAAQSGERVLRELAGRLPNQPEPLVFLARYLSHRDRDAARAVFESAVTRFPESVTLRVAFADQLAAWGEDADAVEQLEAARTRVPAEPRLALAAGRSLARESRLDEARIALEIAIRALQGSEWAEAAFWLMAVCRDQGDHVRAERYARRLVMRLGPGQSSLLEDVADYLEERHDFLRARQATERARQLRRREE